MPPGPLVSRRATPPSSASHFGTRRRQVALLHVAVAADLFRDARDLDRQRQVARRRAPRSSSSMLSRYSPISARSVLRSSVRPNTSKAVPRRPLSLASTPKALSIQGPNWRFCSSPLSLRLAMQRRRQVVVELVVALELRRDLLVEARVGVQARDLVLVLVGHQLEQVARHRFAQRWSLPSGASAARTLLDEGACTASA